MIMYASWTTSDNNKTITGYLEGCNQVIERWATKIASGAFRNCTSLTSVAAPYVSEVESYAFSGCICLRSLRISSHVIHIGNNAFENCTSLTSISISKSIINKIEDCVFKGCKNLAKIMIPITVEEIGQNAFCGCSSLTSIEIPSHVTKIGNSAFSGCTSLNSIEIPRSVKKIGRCTFAFCSNLNTVEIPDSVTEIGWGAFNNCSGIINIFVDSDNNYYRDVDGVLYTKDLSKLIFVPNKYDKFIVPDKVKEIGEFAFDCCTKLTSIKIPNSVTMIGESAFRGCTCLTIIRIPNSVTKIEVCAFSNCIGVKNIFVDANNHVYCDVDGVLYTKNLSKIIFVPNKFEKYIVPHKVKEIEKSAFAYCSNLVSVEIPNSITKIEDDVFNGCTKLKSIKIPNGVTEIGDRSFSGCTSLASIKIPDSVLKIGRDAFKRCNNLTSIVIPSNVRSIDDSAFIDCTGIINIFVDSHSPFYCDDDGVLYTKDKSELLFVPYKYVYFFVPNTVTKIKKGAFIDRTSLTSIEIPKSVTAIEKGSFNGCTNLREIYIRRNQPADFSLAFEGLDFTKITLYVPYGSVDSYRSDNKYMGFKEILNKTKQYDCLSLSDDNDIVISCQKDCKGVVIIPNCVIVIGDKAFEGCASLSSLEIPNTVIKIGKYALNNCIMVTSLLIPNSVTEIGENAFTGCRSLVELHLRNKEPIDFSAAFEGLDLSKITLYVPIGSGYDYRHHPFYSKFKEVVTEK